MKVTASFNNYPGAVLRDCSFVVRHA